MIRHHFLLGVALLATGGSALATSTVVAHYKMGELESAAGTAVGATAANLLPTVGAVNIPVTGTPTIAAGGPATARGGSTHYMNFDGVQERYQISPDLLGAIPTDWMIEAWARPQPGATGLEFVVSHGDGARGQIISYDATNGKYGWYSGGLGQINGTVGPTGVGTVWDHLALVREAGVTSLYVNGVFAGSNAATGAGNPNYNNGSGIGSQYSGGGDHGFTGDIDEVYFSTVSGFNSITDLHMKNPPDPLIGMPGGPVAAGTVVVSTTAPAYVNVVNNGVSNTLTISSVSGLSGDTGKFILETPLPLNIAPGDTGTLEFTYTPGATAGNHSAVFTINNNDANNPTPTVTLTGSAITDPNFIVASTLAFGSVASTGGPTTRQLPISNTGLLNDLNLSLTVTGADAGKFTIVYPDPPSMVVGSGANDVIEISCDPAGSLGAFTATLQITHNDPDLPSPLLVTLTANSIPRYSEVAHYRLGESDADLATTVDDTGGNNLTNINGTPGTSYNVGSGVVGSTKGISETLNDVYTHSGVPAALAGRTQNWGMEVWLRPELATGSAQIGGGYGGLYFGVGNGSRGGFSIFSIDGTHWGLNVGGKSAPNSPVSIQGSIWTHVAAVTVDNQVRLYVNGLLAYTYSGVGYAPDDTGSPVIELGGQTAAQFRTAGGVDEARIFTFVSGQFNPATDLHVTPPADADGDGLADAWEDQYFGNNDGTVTWAELAATDGTGDADHDGSSDKAEYLAGTDPQDENSFPVTEPLAITNTTKVGNTVTVTFNGVAGKTYTLKKSLTLESFPTTCGTLTLSGASGTLQDTSATEPKAFYRIEKQ
ncbi:MAG: LamG-like jellyroll fold domain-containing protein [Luteolibacter sp.]